MAKNEMIMLTAAKGKRPERTPVWIEVQMLILPEYKKLDEKYGFDGIARNAELAARATVMPVTELGVDAAILFSDLLVPAEGMGIKVKLSDKGPKVENPVRTIKDVEKLIVPEPEEGMKNWLQTIRIAKKELTGKAPIIGWVGAPFLLASFMVEGGIPAPFFNIKKMMYSEPKTVHLFFSKLADMAIKFLFAQVEAGAEITMLFDIVAGAISPWEYREFALPHVQKIVSAIKTKGLPLIYHSNGTNFLPYIKDTEIDIIGLDWTVEMKNAVKVLEGKKVMQGNMDPYLLLFGSKEQIAQSAKKIHEEAKDARAHIFSLGGWIHKDTSVEKTKYLIDLVHSL